MKKLIVALFVLMLPLSAPAQGGGKMGYVDLQRALSESSAGKAARDKFKVEVERLQSRLKKQKDEIDRLNVLQATLEGVLAEQLEQLARVVEGHVHALGIADAELGPAAADAPARCQFARHLEQP